MNGALPSPWNPGPARPDELAPAFRLLFQHADPAFADFRIANSLELVQKGELDREGILVVRGPDGLLGAALCMPVPGAGALVWPPQAVPHRARAEIEDRLLRTAADWLRGRGTKLAQALLVPREAELAAPLLRNGFVHVTTLWYLRHRLEFTTQTLGGPRRLRYRPYRPGDGEFERTLVRTYEQTRDCPEVNGVREVAEVLEGHRSQGHYDPDRWWLALEGDCPVGVLLLAELLDGGGWDVSYVGVVPEARRRGFGRELTQKALWEAKAGGAAQLTLSVDARNEPARELYFGMGFEPYDEREVYLAIWRDGQARGEVLPGG